MKIKRKLIASILVLALVATAFTVVSAQLNSSGSAPMGVGGRPDDPCGMSQLTDEEREEIRQQMEEYRQELFEQYGLSCPTGSQFAYEGGNGPRGRMGLGMQGFQRGPDFSEFLPTPPDLDI
jgi:hypothetical protein